MNRVAKLSDCYLEKPGITLTVALSPAVVAEINRSFGGEVDTSSLSISGTTEGCYLLD